MITNPITTYTTIFARTSPMRPTQNNCKANTDIVQTQMQNVSNPPQPSFKGGPYFSRVLSTDEMYKKLNAQNIASEILKKFETFGIEEYKNLSQSDKLSLKCCKPFSSESPNELLYLAKTMKANLSKKFPDGYTLVSVGRSPAVIAKFLQSQGEDVKFCPTSRMGSYLFLENVKPQIDKYASYLEKVGITKDIVENSPKTHVFVDYTYTGDSLNHFKQALADEKIGIKGDKAQFLSMNNDLLDCADKKHMKHLIDKWLFDPLGKKFSPIPRATLDDILKKPDAVLNDKESFDSKIMQFHLIDTLEMQKALMTPLIKKCA